MKQGVYVDREYSDEDERERKLLRPILRAARRLPHYRGKCKLDGTTLVIKGKNYTRKNLQSLPNDLNSYDISARENKSTLGFFGELNPLSNFHTSKFMYDGTSYHSSEQLIQHQKAKFFGDKITANRILGAKDPLECKMMACDITNYDHAKWKDEAKVRCEEGIKAKFMQNDHLRAYLLQTDNKTLVECCSDKMWGNGLPIYQEHCLDKTKWTSQGLLGEILEKVRSYITDILGINTVRSESMDTVAPTNGTI